MRRHPGRRELAVFAIAYLTYFGVRAVTEGRIDRALANAASLVHVEDALGIAWEGTVQSLVASSQLLQDVVNWIYIFGHWPVIIGSGVLLYRYRREHYYTLRNVCLLTGAFGLVIFALFPVAPPRLTDLPLMDTVTRGAAAYRQLLPPRLVNQYAAMPSFHAGWNLAVGIVVFRATRHPLLRAFAIAMPVAMAFSVVATANHFVIDVIVGVTLVLLAFQVERAIASVPPPTRREWPGETHARDRVLRPRAAADLRGAPAPRGAARAAAPAGAGLRDLPDRPAPARRRGDHS